MMNAGKIIKLKKQLDLVIKMVEQKREKEYHEYWDEVIKKYVNLRKILDNDIQEVSRLKTYETGVLGLVRNAYDLSVLQDYDDPLAHEMSKVSKLVKELFSSK